MTDEFPVATLHKTSSESYNILGWQKTAVEHMFYHYLRAFYALTVSIIDCLNMSLTLLAKPEYNIIENGKLFLSELSNMGHIIGMVLRYYMGLMDYEEEFLRLSAGCIRSDTVEENGVKFALIFLAQIFLSHELFSLQYHHCL